MKEIVYLLFNLDLVNRLGDIYEHFCDLESICFMLFVVFCNRGDCV